MPKQTTDLDGRTVVITGAGSGIGRALAQRFSRLGNPVAIVDWNQDQLEETASTLGGQVYHQKLDVRDRQGQFAFAAAVKDWSPGRIGLVINNAGVTTAQLQTNCSVEDDEWVLEVNLFGVIHGTRAFLPIMVEQDEGVIANVSSVFGFAGFPTQAAYCASKAAVKNFTEALRAELHGTGVHAVAIHPGGIKTNIVNNARWHHDHRGDADHDKASQSFAKLARTTPDRAAEIIHAGVVNRKHRIRVGGDAVMFDWLVRAFPAGYQRILRTLDKVGERTGQI